MEDFNKKWPKQTSHMPTEKAYAIMTPCSVTIPGDERSRTNPGHGYPEHTEHYWNVEIYHNEKEWKAEIKERHESKYSNKNFVAYVMYPVKVNVSINVNVETED